MADERLVDGDHSGTFDSDVFDINTPVPEESDVYASGPINDDVVNADEEPEATGVCGRISRVCYFFLPRNLRVFFFFVFFFFFLNAFACCFY